MVEIPLSPTLTVDRIFAQWPQTIPVFLRHRFACIGCLMAPFDTLADVARNYNVNLEELQAELMAVILKDNDPRSEPGMGGRINRGQGEENR